MALASDHSVLARLRAVNSLRRSTAGRGDWLSKRGAQRCTREQLHDESLPAPGATPAAALPWYLPPHGPPAPSASAALDIPLQQAVQEIKQSLTDQLLELEELRRLHDLRVQVGRAAQAGQLVHGCRVWGRGTGHRW